MTPPAANALSANSRRPNGLLALLLGGEVATAARLAKRLPRFLRHPLTLAGAEQAVRARLAQREQVFLHGTVAPLYAQPENPYRKLLDTIGCTYADVERLVSVKGVEGALLALLRTGVYLSVAEFKGRRPVVRGSATFQVNPSQLLNPNAVAVLPRASSGSRGDRTLVPLDLDSIRDQSIDMGVGFAAHGALDWVFAVWDVPGGAAIDKVLSVSAFGNRPERWFSQVDPASPGLHHRYRWSNRFLCAISALAGRPLPAPEYVPLDRTEPIVSWALGVVRSGRTPCIRTYASSAVRLAQDARARGISLEGVQFSLGGEPITDARLAAIRASGADAHAVYGVMEAGPLGLSCPNPAAPDDIHLFHDRLALVQSDEADVPAGEPAGALYLTSLLPTARVILLNTSLGDRATLTRDRDCGCAMQSIGWNTHVSAIRSYQKVTAGGMTFLDTDVIRTLEVILPSTFGGSPADYQLMEGESASGRALLRLIVHPSVGSVDEPAVVETFLGSLGVGTGAEHVMELAWREGGVVQVERTTPRTGATGKVLHFHQERKPIPERTPV